MKHNKINGMDGMKAIAIIGISAFHIFPSIIVGGYLGVCLFFLLSGFLLAYTSKNEFHIGKYYIKRFKRIYPPLLITIFTTCCIYYFVDASLLDGMKKEIISIVLGFNNWWQIQQNADYFTRIMNASPFTHLWYMGIELQYYLIWPILFFLYKGFKKYNKLNFYFILLIVLALISASLMPILYSPNEDVTRLYYGTDTRVYALLLGSVIGFLYSKKKNKLSIWLDLLYSLIFILLLCFVGYTFFVLDGQSAIVYRGGMFVMTIVFIILLLSLLHSTLLGKILEIQPLKWIGKHSYGIYLWQYPVIFFFTYMNLNTIPYYQWIEILIILLLAAGMDILLDSLYSFKKNQHKVITILLTVFVCISMGFGGYQLVQAKDEKAEDLQELQEELEQRAEELEKQKQQQIQSKYASSENVVLVGDSILLSTSGYLMDMLPNCSIDAEVSRHLGEELAPLQNYDSLGLLKDTVVIAMGTNGKIYDFLAVQTLDYLGLDRDVFWINVYCPMLEWQNSNNEYLVELSSMYPNLHIIDWYTVAVNHPEYLAGDGIHPNDAGCQAYAEMIKNAIETTEVNQNE